MRVRTRWVIRVMATPLYLRTLCTQQTTEGTFHEQEHGFLWNYRILQFPIHKCDVEFQFMKEEVID